MRKSLYTDIVCQTPRGIFLGEFLQTHFADWVDYGTSFALHSKVAKLGYTGTAEHYALWTAASTIWGYGFAAWSLNGKEARDFYVEFLQRLRHSPGKDGGGSASRAFSSLLYRVIEGHPEPFFVFDQWLSTVANEWAN